MYDLVQNVIAAWTACLVLLDAAPAPPQQPQTGPGGSEYTHGKVIQHKYGEGSSEFWIFEPGDPRPSQAPVIVFNHGWSAMHPRVYGAWIIHLVRRGNIVIYPRYQANLLTPPGEFTPNAIKAIKDALTELSKHGHVKPDRTRLAVVGHSAGGQISANIAALAKESGIPVPKAVMCVEPGKSWAVLRRTRIPLVDLSKIPSNVLLLAVAGEDDRLVRDVDARRIFKESTQVPPENKDLVLVRSDGHGRPKLKANHHAPVAPNASIGGSEEEKARPSRGFRYRFKQRIFGRRNAKRGSETTGPGEARAESAGIDALDYYAFWKLFDALCDAAFYGRNREFALGNTHQQRYMGLWSDGTPVKELLVTDSP